MVSLIGVPVNASTSDFRSKREAMTSAFFASTASVRVPYKYYLGKCYMSNMLCAYIGNGLESPPSVSFGVGIFEEFAKNSYLRTNTCARAPMQNTNVKGSFLLKDGTFLFYFSQWWLARFQLMFSPKGEEGANTLDKSYVQSITTTCRGNRHSH